VGRSRQYFNLLVTFVVSGIWHGANWTFFCWGSLHGVLLCMEKALGIGKQQYSGFQKFCHWIVTFILVCLAWILFRANNLHDAVAIMTGLFFKIGIPDISFAMFTDLCLAAFAIAILLVKELTEEFRWNIHVAESRYWLVWHSYIVVMIALIILLGVLGGDQFIYFQF